MFTQYFYQLPFLMIYSNKQARSLYGPCNKYRSKTHIYKPKRTLA